MEIKEGNKLIAEFMGGTMFHPRDNKKIVAYRDVPPLIQSFTIENARYHESWDWLMLVVEKIEEDESLAVMFMKNDWDNRGIFQIGIYKCFDMKENRERRPIVEKQGDKKIETVWLAIIEFIHWYNTQKDN